MNTEDALIVDLRVPKMNCTQTMRDAADEIKRLRKQIRSTAHEAHKTADAYLELRALIQEWADAEEGYSDIGTIAERRRKVDRLDAAEDALRKAVGR